MNEPMTLVEMLTNPQRKDDGTLDEAFTLKTMNKAAVKVAEYEQGRQTPPMTCLSERLLACPFCGESDAFVERSDFSSSYVTCNNCSARGPIELQDGDEEETPGADAAVRAWNTQACFAEADGVVAARPASPDRTNTQPAEACADDWTTVVRPIVDKCKLAAVLNQNVCWNTQGADALGKLIQEMATKLDYAIALRQGRS